MKKLEITVDGEIYEVNTNTNISKKELFKDLLEYQNKIIELNTENKALKEKIKSLEYQNSCLSLDLHFKENGKE